MKTKPKKPKQRKRDLTPAKSLHEWKRDPTALRHALAKRVSAALVSAFLLVGCRGCYDSCTVDTNCAPLAGGGKKCTQDNTTCIYTHAGECGGCVTSVVIEVE